MMRQQQHQPAVYKNDGGGGGNDNDEFSLKFKYKSHSNREALNSFNLREMLLLMNLWCINRFSTEFILSFCNTNNWAKLKVLLEPQRMP